MNRKILLPIIFFTSFLLISGIQPYTQAISFNQPATLTEDSTYRTLCRITPPLETSDQPINAEVIGGNPNEYLDVLLDEHSVTVLRQKGYTIQKLNNEESIPASFDGDEYHSYENMKQALFDIAEQHQNITSLSSIGKSYEDRNIWCLEISDNPGLDENEPGVLLLGLHHAREWPTLEITLHIAENLTDQYVKDSTIRNLVNNRRIWIVPCVNPDGYYYCHDQGHDWRKNRHFFDEYNKYGVDLNRNYAGSSNGNPLGMWGSTGMSHDPGSSVYCGETQFSEYETQAIKEFFISHDISSCISWHTYSELVMWPWGYSEDEKTPNNEYMSEVGRTIASKITKQSGSGKYTPIQSSGLYPTTGDTTDWMYGYSHYVLGKTCFAYTIEACASFHPTPNYIDQICKENMDGALYLIEETENISQIPQRVLPPKVNTIAEQNDNYMISWNTSNENSNPLKYEIQELTNSVQYQDNATGSTEAWTFDGFTSVSSRSYSEPKSYYSNTYPQSVSTMKTKYPVFINNSNDTVSFYCWYDIKEEWSANKAMFEVSTNDRDYTVIDTFSGKSNGWIKKEYDLNQYEGKSIYLRFRYTKISKNSGEGFYVDNINPVNYFYSVKTLDDTIESNEFVLPQTNLNDYFVRIRGYNEQFGWGDWSTLYSLHHMNNENNPPQMPRITGPKNPKIGKPATYTVQSIDQDNDDMYYFISWGDNTTEEWAGPYQSEEQVTFNHTWNTKNQYQIKVRAKDEHGLTSEWATLDVALPKTKGFFPLWQNILSLLSSLFENIPLI